MNPAAILAQRDSQRELFARRLAERDSRLIAARDSLAEAWDRAVADAEAAEHLAQATIAVAERPRSPAVEWVLSTAEPWAKFALNEAAENIPAVATSQSTFERMQSRGERGERRRRGVFFTPPELVRFVVRGADDLLRDEFSYAAGLAAEELRILDPACGTGYFLEETLRVIFERKPNEVRFVERLLPRIAGLELLPGACLVARLSIAERFLIQGVDPAKHPPPRIVLGNALAGPAKHPLLAEPFSVILGNPPYRGLSENHSPWITELLQTYKQVDGEPLRERKHWLHDDYVKFFRLAEQQVVAAGRGLIAFVTNHGYLDNAGFRGMRRSLMTSLPRINVVDLHGNRKGEVAPDGGRDENVFGIEQGVAVTFLRRTSLPPQVTVADVWGAATDKTDFLIGNREDGGVVVDPQSPDYRFRAGSANRSHDDAWRLCDAMPLNTTAPVTARDGFVIAFTRAELVARLTEFCDLTIDDEVIRAKYFRNSRSHRYPAGDTRSWKLSAVRRKLAADPNVLDCLRPCLYRPFDVRWIAWHLDLVDWSRPELTRHLLDAELLAAGQLCLIARRQSPAGRRPSFFFVSDWIPLDGVIRNDNRGSESLFPLFVRNANGEVRPNFAAEFLTAIESRVRPRTYTPQELAAYIYGLWHSSEYRDQQTAALAADFPRIPLPADAAAFFATAARGSEWIAAHRAAAILVEDGPAETIVATRYPRYEKGVIFAAPNVPVGETSEQAWNYAFGSHQVLYKWLADRRGRTLTAADLAAYRRIIQVVERTAAGVSGT